MISSQQSGVALLASVYLLEVADQSKGSFGWHGFCIKKLEGDTGTERMLRWVQNVCAPESLTRAV
jgi:hypothetical protein